MPSRMQKMWAQKKLTTVFGMGQFCDPKYIEMVGLAGGWDGVWLDNDNILFLSRDAGEKEDSIYRMSTDGKDLKLLIKNARFPTVSAPKT